MTPLFPARRSAERFDALVEGARQDADAPTTELLELVGALRSTPVPLARPEFVADLREQLMVAARSELVVPAAGSRDEVTTRLTIAPRRTHRERRVTVALGAFAIIGATTSMAVASQSALPGDALYPVKRAIENTHTGFSVGDDAKGETLLGNASGRLDEVDQLTQQSDPDAELVINTLNTFSDQATEAGDHLLSDYEQHGNESSIQDLLHFTDHSMAVLGTLEGVIPESAESALLDAAKAVFAVDAAATQVCPGCGTGITDIPEQLLAGGTTAADQATDTTAGGQLPGSVASDSADDPGKGVKGNDPSGLTPPETPVSVPPVTAGPSDPTSDPTSGVTSGPGVMLPSPTVNTGNGHGKPKPTVPVDLTPVTDTVTDVVNGVVNGVNGLLNGLSGQTGTGPTP